MKPRYEIRQAIEELIISKQTFNINEKLVHKIASSKGVRPVCNSNCCLLSESASAIAEFLLDGAIIIKEKSTKINLCKCDWSYTRALILKRK